MTQRLTIGRISFQVKRPTSATVSLQQYGQRVLAGVPGIMAESETRVFEDIRATTPVDTGHMRDHLLRTSDIVPVETEYNVFWRAQEFVGEVNPAGKIIQEFYPVSIIFGTPTRAGRDNMTPALEAERPRLVKDLSQHFARAGK